MKTILFTIIVHTVLLVSSTQAYASSIEEEVRCFDISKDIKKVYEHCKKLAESGSAEAQAFMAGYYYSGMFITKDFEKAFNWYRKSAEKEYPEAEYMLGVMYRNGEYVKRDLAEYYSWTKKSANKYYVPAYWNLALYYGKYPGRQDFVKSYAWASLAAESGHKDGVKLVSMLEKKVLNDDAIKQAKVIIDKFKSKQ